MTARTHTVAPTLPCAPIEAAMEVLGRAWAGAVLQSMLGGAERFSDIRRAVPGVTDTVLTARLRELCARGFAVREVDAGPPVQVSYRLTELGRGTQPVLAALADFGRSYQASLRGMTRDACTVADRGH